MLKEMTVRLQSNAIPDAEATWIAELRASIWEEMFDRAQCRTWHNACRLLTNEEKRRLFSLIKRHNLPCVIDCGSFGFGLSLTVYNHAIIPGVQPERLICITDQHIVPPTVRGDEAKRMRAKLFSHFAYTEENRRMLAYYGFPPPSTIEQCEY